MQLYLKGLGEILGILQGNRNVVFFPEIRLTKAQHSVPAPAAISLPACEKALELLLIRVFYKANNEQFAAQLG